VLTILRNTAYSWLEKNRRTDMVAIDDLEARERDVLENGASTSIDWHVPTPEAELIEKANAEQLRAAIERLPVEFRETSCCATFRASSTARSPRSSELRSAP